MNQKKPQKSCSATSREFNPVTTKRYGNKRIYETADKNGGVLTLIIKKPISKLAQKIRDMLFIKGKR